MNTTTKQLKYITAAMMFILLAVFLTDNPIKGNLENSIEDPNTHQDLAIYMCIFYAITTVWFWNNTLDQKTKSKIFVIGAVIGLVGVIGQLISYNMDFSKYVDALQDPYAHEYRGEDMFFAIYEDEYPITSQAWQNILAGCAFASYIALLGLMCAKTQNKQAKYALFATMAIMLFVLICPHLPLEKSRAAFDSDSGKYHDKEELVKSKENLQFIAMGLVFLSWTLTMLLYKDEEKSPKKHIAHSAQPDPVAPVSEVVVESAVEPEVIIPEPAAVLPEQKVAVAPEATSDETVLANMKATPRRTGALSAGTSLQNGRYVIEEVLAQGGFGVTYLAIQRGLNRKVAIKEFFMKEYCDRDSISNHVSMGTAGNMDMVAKFKKQFIKEAQTLAEMFNQHIVKVYDIFEDYGTAYYVMEYISGDSLAKKVVGNPADNATALNYMNQICQALADIHKLNILHLDVKPNNLLFRNNGDLVLIDFGISKHYDEADGSQASLTHIGISKGYAPLEQYNKGGITQFTPATDIYSLGATLYTIVTGKIPPEANVIYEDGLDEFPSSVSPAIQNAIIKAMDPRRKQRPQSIDEFARILNS